MSKTFRFIVVAVFITGIVKTSFAQHFAATGAVTDVSCYGGSNGKIVYQVSGSPGPVYYRWNTGDSGLATGGCTYAVNINNPGAALSGFQVRVLVPLMPGSYNFSNVIFTDSAGNPVPFWLTDFPGTDSAIFWVRVSSVPTGNSQIFLSFCGTNSVSAGTPDSVFEFFDDFDHAAYNWQDSAVNTINGGSGSMVYDGTNFYSAPYSMNLIAASSCFTPPYSGGGSAAWLKIPVVNDSLVIDFDDKVETTLWGYCVGGTGQTNSVWADAVNLGNGQSIGQGGSCASNSTGWRDNSSNPFVVTTGQTTIMLRTYGGDCSMSNGWFDDVRIRKYSSNPPVATLDTTPQLELDNLTAGNYIITMHDSAGQSNQDTFVVTQPQPLVLTLDSVNTYCGAGRGKAWVNVSGGTPAYTYLWSDSASTDTITSLSAGSYLITVTDANSCSGAGSITIVASGDTSVSITQDKTIMCAGDTAHLCAPAGYAVYAWSVGDNTLCVSTTLPGNYDVTVTDTLGCTATSQQLNVAVYPQFAVVMTVSGDTLQVYDGSSYQWYYNDTLLPGGTGAVLVATESGLYNVTETDTNGCQVASTNQNITVVKEVGVDQLTNEAVRIFPNPLIQGAWRLEVSADWIGGYCNMYDAAGRLVYQDEIRNRSAEILMNMAPGVLPAKGIFANKECKSEIDKAVVVYWHRGG